MNNEISEKRKVAPATFLLFLPPPPKALNPKPTLCHPRLSHLSSPSHQFYMSFPACPGIQVKPTIHIFPLPENSDPSISPSLKS